jgi:hypothetical protein
MKEKGIVKTGECKGCKRHEKLYNEQCLWCIIEAMRGIAEDLEKEMTDNVSLIDKVKLQPIRDRLLDLV